MTNSISLVPAGLRWVDLASHRHFLFDEANRLLDFYERRQIDPKGGFFDLDDGGHPLPTGWPPAAKPTRNLFQTTRQIHCFALAALMGRPGADRVIDHGMDFLWNHHRDMSHGGYFWANGYAAPTNDTKQAYGHAFVLLAASSAKVAGHPDADRLLADISTVLTDRFWEERHGAVAEEFAVNWTPLGRYRGQNSNMHLTEALMAAFEATGESLYLERAERIATLLIRTITAGNGWRLPEHFDADWTIDAAYDLNVFRPYGSTIGHWLEWSRLVLQLWALTGRRHDWMTEASRTLFVRAVEEGWDATRGGFYFTVGWDGQPVDRDRYWWPCTEGIGAAASLNAAFPDNLFEFWYRRIWNWTERHLIDRHGGSWRHQLNDALDPVVDPWFGKPDLYHSLQACLIPLVPCAGGLAHGLATTGVVLHAGS